MAARNEPETPQQSSQLFTLRMWLEELGEGQTGWRGKLQHVTSGEVRYFHDWQPLEEFVEELLRNEGLASNNPQGVDQGGKAENGP